MAIKFAGKEARDRYRSKRKFAVASRPYHRAMTAKLTIGATMAAALNISPITEQSAGLTGGPVSGNVQFLVVYADGTAALLSDPVATDANGDASFVWSPASSAKFTVYVIPEVIVSA